MGQSSPGIVSTKLQWIAKLARRVPKMTLTTLAHHVYVEFLKEAFRRTNKKGAVGVDGRTAKEYESDLEGNLERLLQCFKSETYYAP